MGAINNISFTYPPFSLLTQPEEVSDSIFCDENNIPAHCIDKPQCPCIYRIKVSLNSTVELVIVDESAGNFFLIAQSITFGSNRWKAEVQYFLLCLSAIYILKTKEKCLNSNPPF